MHWLYLLAVQGTLKNLLQRHRSKASILWHSAFFMVQLSRLYMTTGKTRALTVWTFVGKVVSLLFNILSRFSIALFFFPRSNCLNFLAAVSVCSDFGAQENKYCHSFHFPPFYLPWSQFDGECKSISIRKICPPSLILREKKSKAQCNVTSHPLGWLL